jgi:hypothetical protein
MNSPGLRSGQGITFSVSRIESISLRKKNAIAKSALIGLGIGLVTGVVAGLTSGDDHIAQYPSAGNDPLGLGSFAVSMNNMFALTAGEKALVGGVVLGTGGVITGIIIGALAKKKFIIGHKKENFRDLEGELRKRLIVQ